MNKNLLQATTLLFLLCGNFLFSQSNLELAKITGDSNPIVSGPTKSAQTVFFLKNTTGTTFGLYNTTPLSATFEVTNEQYAFTAPDNQSSINFGKAVATGGRTLYAPLDVFGPPANGNFTTSGATTAGTGIDIKANHGINMLVSTQPLKAAGAATNGTYHMADLKITFNRPVNNPVLHLAGLGQNTAQLGFATRLDLTASNQNLNDLTLTRRSGNTPSGFQVEGKSIFNGNTSLSATANEGHGSVQINGLGITTLTFKVSIKGLGQTGLDPSSWASDVVSGDGVVISLSVLESDLQITNTVNNTLPTLGQDVIFTVVAKNNGPSANTGILVQNKLPARYQYVSKVVPAGTTYNETTGVWTIGNLADGGSATLTITAKVLFAGTSSTQANISSTGGISDPDPTNNIASVTNACVVEQGNASFDVPATEGAKKFTVIRPLANKGFVVDISILDNSFNLSVNGTLLLPTEVQFQSASTTGINVEFVDGTQYEVGTGVAGSRSIFQMTGTVSAPLVRVVVSDTGAVTLFGSKVSGGPLFPLRLKGTATFNTIPVNNNNNVVITQIGTGPTGITGSIYGINSTTCVCYNDANFSVGTPAATQHGITLLKRAGADNGNWPMNRNSAFTALESNTRGFVITRHPTATLGNITAPQEGMMVYDTTADCLKIYDGTGWKCFSVPTCP